MRRKEGKNVIMILAEMMIPYKGGGLEELSYGKTAYGIMCGGFWV